MKAYLWSLRQILEGNQRTEQACNYIFFRLNNKRMEWIKRTIQENTNPEITNLTIQPNKEDIEERKRIIDGLRGSITAQKHLISNGIWQNYLAYLMTIQLMKSNSIIKDEIKVDLDAIGRLGNVRDFEEYQERISQIEGGISLGIDMRTALQKVRQEQPSILHFFLDNSILNNDLQTAINAYITPKNPFKVRIYTQDSSLLHYCAYDHAIIKAPQNFTSYEYLSEDGQKSLRK